ncbi:MAG TPA: hypothetical protein VFP15_01685, partial [Gemmatimonadaceae bacterium]|nr:hypothetical protein [Gemmatimonadaceae bacterium]
MLAPRRRRGFEYLDDPATPADVRERSLRDVHVANTLLGGTHAVLAELRRILPALGERATLLDVGTGAADIPAASARLAERRGVRLTTFAVDEAESLLHAASTRLDHGICADARRLP